MLSSTRAAETERALLAKVLQDLPVGVMVAEAPLGRILYVNGVVESLWGKDWPRSASVEDYRAWGPHRPDGTPYPPDEVPLARAVRHGETVAGEPMMFPGPDGSWLHFEVNAAPICRSDGTVEAAVAVFEDVAERRRAAERQRLLLNELNHRVKNMLAVVRAMARQTGGRSTVASDFLSNFEGRLRALATAHELLTRNSWESIGLHGVVHAALGPHLGPDGSRIRLEVAEAMLGPEQAETLSLALHELATNASKYGALSAPAGHVTLTGRIEDGGLQLVWREEQGPPVEAPPAGRGFGMMLLEQAIAYQHRGRVTFDWARPGLTCRIVLPLKDAGRTP